MGCIPGLLSSLPPISDPPCSSLGPLYFTYGLVFACGCSFSYQPSLVILGHYFQRRLGLVNGIVTAGSSIFTIILPFALSFLLELVGLYHTMRVLCILLFVLMLAGFTYKPLLPAQASDARAGRRCPPTNQIFNFNIWKSVGYRIWAFGIPAALYGYFVPYVHLVSPSAMLSLEFVLFVLLLLPLLLLLISAQKSKGPSDKDLLHTDAAGVQRPAGWVWLRRRASVKKVQDQRCLN